MKILLPLLLLTWAQVTPAQPAAAPPLEDWRIERLQGVATLGDDHTLEIHNPWGDVRCRPSDDDSVQISGLAQRHRDDPRKSELGVGSAGGKLNVRVLYPPSGEKAAGITPEMDKRRVDLTVIVPAAARLVIRTEKGLAEAKVGANEVDVATTTGDVVVATAGPVRARSDRGKIKATFKSTDWETASSLSTVTGDVEVWLPPAAGVTVEAETTGLITTDYSIQIRRDAPGSKKMAVAVLGEDPVGDGAGDEQRSLSITTVKGAVQILQSRW